MEQPECNEVRTSSQELVAALQAIAEGLPEGWIVEVAPGGQLTMMPPYAPPSAVKGEYDAHAFIARFRS